MESRGARKSDSRYYIFRILEGGKDMKINEVEIVSTDNMTDMERYITWLKSLIVTPEGSLPGNRGFGLKMDFLSAIPAQAVNLLAIELDEKVQEYIPEITIANVELLSVSGGELNIKIHIERRV